MNELEQRIDRRKVIAGALGGVGALLLLGSVNRAEAQTPPSNSVGLFDKNAEWINPATEDTLALIKTNTTGLLKSTDVLSVSGNLGRNWTITEVVPISHANLDAALSTLAKESGGNLATLTTKDFATQATLALIKDKTDNLDVALSLIQAKTDNLDAAISTLLSISAFQARINTQGQKLMAASTPVVLASDQGAIPASQSGVWTVQAQENGNWTVGQSNAPWRHTLEDAVTATNKLVIDSSGRITVLGSGLFDVTPTSPLATDYLPVRLTDGSAFYTASGGGGAASDANVFSAYFDDIAPAANKYMATLFNTSTTRKVVIRSIELIYRQTAAVTGVVLNQELRRITARTAGTSVTPTSMDSNDALSAGITTDTGSTSVTDSALLSEHITSSEELLAADELAQGFLFSKVLYEKKAGIKGHTLRQNQGITVKNITSSTVGAMSFKFEFSDEAA